MLCIMYYTVCYLTGIFHAVVRQISMLFIDNKNFCILYSVLLFCMFVVVVVVVLLASLFVCLFVFITNFYWCTLLIHVVTNRSLCENIKKHRVHADKY